MQVILVQDVKDIGKKGDLIEVSDGHARNYLLPRKLAVAATKSNLNELELKNQAEAHKESQLLNHAKELSAKLSAVVVTIPAKIGTGGKLFGSITNKEISDALLAQHNIKIDKKKIELTEPIKTITEKTVDVKLHSKVMATLKIIITEA